MKTIELTGEYKAIVDDEDYEWLSQRKWSAAEVYPGYVYAVSGRGSMHRFITKAKKGEIVDHVNGNRLDNRRENLRVCTPSQNSMNRKPKRKTSSQYKGLTWISRRSKWQVRIVQNYKAKFLGYYENELHAALVYDGAALKYHGEFAQTNFDWHHRC